MEERSERLENICDMLICEVENELTKLSSGECICIAELGETIDMIKDISEIKRNSYEAAYYHKHTSGQSQGEETNISTMDSITANVRKMWKEATPEAKKTMKMALASLMSEMNV